jgi:hypothetical protein
MFLSGGFFSGGFLRLLFHDRLPMPCAQTTALQKRWDRLRAALEELLEGAGATAALAADIIRPLRRCQQSRAGR